MTLVIFVALTMLLQDLDGPEDLVVGNLASSSSDTRS